MHWAAQRIGFLGLIAVVSIGITAGSSSSSITPVPASDLCPTTGPAPTTSFCVTPQEAAMGEIPINDLASIHETPGYFLSQGENLTIGPNDIAAVSQQQAEQIALAHVITHDLFLKPAAHPQAVGAVLAVINAPYIVFPQMTPASNHPLMWIVNVNAPDGFDMPPGNIGEPPLIYSNAIVFVDATTGQIGGGIG